MSAFDNPFTVFVAALIVQWLAAYGGCGFQLKSARYSDAKPAIVPI